MSILAVSHSIQSNLIDSLFDITSIHWCICSLISLPSKLLLPASCRFSAIFVVCFRLNRYVRSTWLTYSWFFCSISSFMHCYLIALSRTLDFRTCCTSLFSILATFNCCCCSGTTSALSLFLSIPVIESGADCRRALFYFFCWGSIDFFLIYAGFSFFFDNPFEEVFDWLSSEETFFRSIVFDLICVGPAIPATVWRSGLLVWNIIWLK